MQAHHSFAGEFDDKKAVSLRGTITKIDWVNPHVFIYLDVKEDDGNVVNWTVETGSPLALTRSGWTREVYRIGDLVTIGGFRSKDARNYASGLQVRRKLGGHISIPPEPK